MNKRLSILLASTGLLLALSIGAACGGSSSSTTTPTAARTAVPATQASAATTAPTATPKASTAATSPAAGASATVLTSSNATLGKTILVNSAGFTLYTFANDTAGTSACTGPCATVWPPLPPGNGTPTGGAGVMGTLATITRSDGTKQVTYNGKPLYTFQSDGSAGQATGNGVNSFSAATP
jgi:predicted lipoprotein with Yx(FWY)xxD motif